MNSDYEVLDMLRILGFSHFLKQYWYQISKITEIFSIEPLNFLFFDLPIL